MKKITFMFMILFLLSISYSQIQYLKDLTNNIASQFYSPSSCPVVGYPTVTTFGLPDEMAFLSNSLIAIIASFLISMVFYLAAKILNHPNATTILTTKLSDLFNVLLILLVFSVMFQVAYLPKNSIIDNYQIYAFEYNGKVLYTIFSAYPTLFLANYLFYGLYNVQLPVTVGKNNIFGFHLNIGPVFKPLVDLSSVISSFIGLILGEFLGRFYFLCFIRWTMLPFLLPLGFVLRMFNATKGGGATLIALTISFFVVYPAMLSINYAIYNLEHWNVIDFTKESTFISTLKMLGLTSVSAVILAVISFLRRFRNVRVSGILSLVRNISYVVLGIFALMFLIGLIKLYIELVTLIAVYGFLLPAINIFVTLSVARDLARILAIDLDLSAFVKLI